jgi:hypothetical protein
VLLDANHKGVDLRVFGAGVGLQCFSLRLHFYFVLSFNLHMGLHHPDDLFDQRIRELRH